MKVIGSSNDSKYIVEMSREEITKFCGNQNSNEFGSIYVGSEYTISSVFHDTSKMAEYGSLFATRMNDLLQHLNSVQHQTKTIINTYHEALPYAKAFADFEIKPTQGSSYNTRKVTLKENPPTFELTRHGD
jgi:hypothetical protein